MIIVFTESLMVLMFLVVSIACISKYFFYGEFTYCHFFMVNLPIFMKIFIFATYLNYYQHAIKITRLCSTAEFFLKQNPCQMQLQTFTP